MEFSQATIQLEKFLAVRLLWKDNLLFVGTVHTLYLPAAALEGTAPPLYHSTRTEVFSIVNGIVRALYLLSFPRTFCVRKDQPYKLDFFSSSSCVSFCFILAAFMASPI